MDNFFMYKKAVRAMDEINRVMEGKGHTVHQIMTAILAGGHILIEDIPGVGKTTLALAFSKVLGLDYQRIQFTPDIMPTDIAGFSIYHQGSEEFEFKEGAAMTNLLLADVVALEANYDYNMLMTGPYPYYLKTRIASQRGHLCNEENAATLVRLLENGCERFALCHISQENNTPELALESVRAALLGAGIVPGRDCVVNAARRHEVSPIIEF